MSRRWKKMEVPGLEKVLIYETVGSTNDEAKLLAREGYPEGTLVIAEEQTKGRGRKGRDWFSVPGKSLTFSLLLRPPQSTSLALLCALSCAWALEEKGFRVLLRWPNDILLGDKKAGGILVESSFSGDELLCVVVGVGINVNETREDFPPSLRESATSLFLASSCMWQRGEILRSFLSFFFPVYFAWKERGGDFSPWIEDYEKRSSLLGKEVVVRWGERTVRGVARGVKEDGSLVLANFEGETLVSWGEAKLHEGER